MNDQYTGCQKRNHTHYFVIRVGSNEYEQAVSHVAIELKPSAIFYLVFAYLVARVARAMLGWKRFYNLEVTFLETDWLDWQPPEDDPDAEYPQAWDEGDVVAAEAIRPEWLANEGLRGRSVQVTGNGGLWFTCYHKHSGIEFTSTEVELSALLKTIRRADVAAELREWFRQTRLGRMVAGGAA